MEEIRNEVNVNEEIEMEDEYFDFEDEFDDIEPEPEKMTFSGKVKSFGGKIASKAKAAGQWVRNNPSEAVEVAGAILGALLVGGTVVKGVSEAKKIERTVYDDFTGECVELKKKLTNEDKIELANRMSNGEDKITALNSMNKIKVK